MNSILDQFNEAATVVPDPEMLDAALEYIKRGWFIVPVYGIRQIDGVLACTCEDGVDCERAGKHAIIAGWNKEASRDEVVVRGWFSKHRDMNIGIRGGDLDENNFLWILDIDPLKGGEETLEDLIERNGPLPPTYEVKTGSGGRHLYWRSTHAMRTTSGREATHPGLDTRGGDGKKLGYGYVVAPPSRHISGQRYLKEHSSPDTLDTAPEWLVKAFSLASVKSDTVAGNTGEYGPIYDGTRHNTLVSIGCSMRAHGCGLAVIRDALIELNENRCKPPLDLKVVEHLARQVCKKPPGYSKDSKKKKEAHPVEFQRGDHLELGNKLAEDLRGDSQEPVVFDRNALWRYDAQTGIYKQITDSDARRVIESYAGKWANKTKPRPLQFSHSDVMSIIKQAQQSAANPEFFNEAISGICFSDAFVQVTSGGGITAMRHSPEFRCTAALPFKHDPTAKAERWLQFLHEIWPVEDVEEIIQFFEEWVGATLLGEITRFAVCPILIGEGANGKSVLLKVIRSLFPSETVCASPPHTWSNKFHLGILKGARINIVNELPDEKITGGDAFKAIMSGDELLVDEKHKKPFIMRCVAGHIFACNTLPSSQDQSDGYWRRWIVVPFPRIFTESDRDIELYEKLMAEISGITTRVVSAAARLVNRSKFIVPASLEKAKNVWRYNNNEFAQFLAEKGFDIIQQQHGRKIQSSSLYRHFVEWAKLNGYQEKTIKTHTAFGIAMKRFLIAKEEPKGKFYVMKGTTD